MRRPQHQPVSFAPGRRRLLTAGMALLAGSMTAARAQQRYPTRTVRMIVGYPPGQAADLVARLLAQQLSTMWKQSVVVENRGGGMGVPAMMAAKNATADGHTMVMATTGTLATNQSLLSKLPYRPLDDFAPVSNVIMAPLLLVAHRDFPARSLSEFLAYAREAGRRVPIATPGQGTSQHLTLELFARRAGFGFEHLAYRGSGPAVIDLVAGQVPLMLDSVASSLPHINGGRLRALAVTSPQRVAQLPETPTFAEAGFPEVDGMGLAGLVVPAATPPALVQQISADVRRALEEPSLRAAFIARCVIPDPRTPEDFAQLLRSETAKWANVIRQAGIRIEE